MITIPSLSDVTDILDTDQVMVTNSQGQSYKIAGSELNKRHKVIIASSTTVTGAPLKAGWPVRIYFTADITAANATTTMQINYNNVNYYVKVPKNGALANYVAFNLGGSPAVFKYVQAYTTLELLFDGTQFIIMCNPVVISGTNFSIYADGLKRVDEVTENGTDLVTSHAVAAAIDKVKDIMASLPTDAVLHYSFDDVPDYPDDTAQIKRLNGDTYSISVSSVGTITTDAYSEDGKIHKSNVNGNANYKTNTGSNISLGIYLPFVSYKGKLIIVDFIAKSTNLSIRLFYRQTSENPRIITYPLGEQVALGRHRICLYVPDECFEYSLTFYSNSATPNYTEWEFTGYYVGDGSYNTPIIDNANGQFNAVNNGGIAVKGVSGKGILLPARTSGEISISSIIPNTDRDISVSLWVKFDTTYSQANQLGLFLIGLTNGLFGFIRIGSGNNVDVQALARVSSSETSGLTVSLQKGMVYHLTMTYDKTQKRVKLYVNGEYKGQGNALTTSNFDFGEPTQFLWKINRAGIVQGAGTDTSITTPHTIDDLLIFDRALTENEVMALYLNKANTPKYYPPAQLPS